MEVLCVSVSNFFFSEANKLNSFLIIIKSIYLENIFYFQDRGLLILNQELFSLESLFSCQILISNFFIFDFTN